jgi:hypothetical protein
MGRNDVAWAALGLLGFWVLLFLLVILAVVGLLVQW